MLSAILQVFARRETLFLNKIVDCHGKRRRFLHHGAKQFNQSVTIICEVSNSTSPQQQRPIKKGYIGIEIQKVMFQFIKKVMCPLIKKVVFSFIKKVMLPFCILLPIIRNDLPLFASGILGPSIYLTIKAFSCLLLLPLFLRLDNHREDEALLTLVLFAFRFATASPYGPCIITFMDIDSCILEYEVMAAAGTIILLAFFIWAGAIEREMKLLLVVCLVLLASKVVEFSLFVDEVSFFMLLLLYFWFLEMLHAFRIVDDSVHQQIKITKSEIAYYGFCSCVMICSFNAIVLPANLKNYLL